MDAADSAGAEERDADPGGNGERAAHRRRADGALNRAGREVAGAGLACVGREALELARLETYADAAVEHADRRRHGARVADGLVAREPDLDAVRRGEPVGDQRRLERDDRVAGIERGANLIGDLDGLAARSPPATASRRAAACSGRRPRARDRALRRSTLRRARLPHPSCRRLVRTGRAARSSPSNEHPRAPRLRIQVRRRARAAEDLLLRLVREDDVRRDRTHSLAELRRRPQSRIALQVARSTLTPRSLRPRELDGTLSGAAGRLVEERVPRDEEMVAALEPRRTRSRPALKRAAAVPRSDAIERSPSGETSEQITPFRPSAGPRTSTPVASSPASARRPASSSPRFPRSARSRRATAAHAATFAACPPGASRISAFVSPPTESGSASRTITSSVRSPMVQTSIALDRKICSWTAMSGAAGFAPSSWAASSARPQPCRGRAPAPRPTPPWPSARPRRVRERTLLSRAHRERAREVCGPGRRLAFRPRADLRVPLPERAHVRGLPEDVRPARRGLRDLRRGSRREDPLPRRRALQGIGVLLDRLRPGGARTEDGDTPPTTSPRTSRPRRPRPARRRHPRPRATSQSLAPRAAGAVETPLGRCQRGGPSAEEHRDRGHVVL